MTKLHALALLLAFTVLVLAVKVRASQRTKKPLDLVQVVEAIRQVEHWNGSAIGAANERGPWQMTYDTWSDFSNKPFWWAGSHARDCKAEQHRVALAYVTWIHDNLIHIPLNESAYSIALVFTCGYSGVKHGKPSRAKRDYAQRVQNIYDELTKR